MEVLLAMHSMGWLELGKAASLRVDVPVALRIEPDQPPKLAATILASRKVTALTVQGKFDHDPLVRISAAATRATPLDEMFARVMKMTFEDAGGQCAVRRIPLSVSSLHVVGCSDDFWRALGAATTAAGASAFALVASVTTGEHGTIPEGLREMTALTQLRTFEGYDKCASAPGFTGSLTHLPDVVHLTNLTTLDLCRCELVKLPDLRNLPKLTRLGLVSCKRLTSAPGIADLTTLTYLNMFDCEALTTALDFSNLTTLTKLDLGFCSTVPTVRDLSMLAALTWLNLTCCLTLESVPGLSRLAALRYLSVDCLFVVDERELCAAVSSLRGLTHLRASLFGGSAYIDYSNFAALARLNLAGNNFRSVPLHVSALPELTHLDLSCCTEITSLPNMSRLKKLRFLDLSKCHSLTDLLELSSLSALVTLKLAHCEGLEHFPADLTALTRLAEVTTSGCRQSVVDGAARTLRRVMRHAPAR
eukprot:TRINITY_DN8095_c0_g1_i1.p1 TRINITY_DN8095_c0_g1~~TRINITY_DN8095_c0_g1_i1.p1  ORF type:complete len:558 (+),score=73.18 TRINITY_DN8095_c0_g1_i1:248-1675(+)